MMNLSDEDKNLMAQTSGTTVAQVEAFQAKVNQLAWWEEVNLYIASQLAKIRRAMNQPLADTSSSTERP